MGHTILDFVLSTCLSYRQAPDFTGHCLPARARDIFSRPCRQLAWLVARCNPAIVRCSLLIEFPGWRSYSVVIDKASRSAPDGRISRRIYPESRRMIAALLRGKAHDVINQLSLQLPESHGQHWACVVTGAAVTESALVRTNPCL